VLFKTFHGKLFVDLKMPFLTPDRTEAWNLSFRRMQLGSFAGCAVIDDLSADCRIAWQWSVFPHLHVTL
jgi:hypothetical protein